MSAKSKVLVFSVLAALLLVSFGCASAPKAPEATAEDTSWMFHTIVDTAFVQQYAKVPVPADTMIVDSRPKKPKFDKFLQKMFSGFESWRKLETSFERWKV